MRKLYNTITALILLFIAVTSHAADLPPDVFIKKGCSKDANKKHCLCETQIRYDNLTDKEKGFAMIFLETEAQNSSLNQDELYSSILELYDPDGSIQKSILAKKDKIDIEIQEKCNK